MASDRLQEGTLLNGRYRVQRALGHGGMGTVYLAEHERLDTVVAVKEVRGRPDEGDEFRAAMEQCEKEARLLVRLNHPNLPKVTDAFTENDRFYLVMEYIEGVALETRWREAGGKPMDVAQVVEWGLQLADALAYLHSQDPPIIFRDLKPANMMVQPDGSVRLIDFGIARRFQPGAYKDTALLGSVGYSPPEQFGRHQTDPRSDIYAFGATLHQLLTGHDPAEHPFKFTAARQLNPRVPETLSRLLEDCLALDAVARPAGIHEVAVRLLAVRDELAASPPANEALDAPITPLPDEPAAPTGPRIISAKLNEAQKRRSGSHDIHGGPSGTITEATERRFLVVGIVLLLLAIAAGTAWVLNKPKNPQKSPAPPGSSLPVVNKPQGTTPPPTEQAPTMETPPPDAPTPTPEAPAATLTVDPLDVMLDEQGGYWLRLLAKGIVRDREGASGRIAVFFYDEQGNPLSARDPQSPYANSKGQLSVAQSLNITSKEYPFEMWLEIPANQFPPFSAAPKLQYRGAVFADKRRIGDSEMRVLTTTLWPNGFFSPAP